MAAFNKMNDSELQALSKVVPPVFTGVEQSEEVLQWIWENFSAVAGDQPSFECWRKCLFVRASGFRTDRTTASQKDYLLHEVLLSGWGMPIGELFDCEKLAAHCQKLGRYSFFVVSEPCCVPGGVASPPNILALF